MINQLNYNAFKKIILCTALKTKKKVIIKTWNKSNEMFLLKWERKEKHQEKKHFIGHMYVILLLYVSTVDAIKLHSFKGCQVRDYGKYIY